MRERIRNIELDLFMQECMELMPANTVLASVAIIIDKSIVHAQAPNRLVLA